jgi:hypothetical protein
VIHAQETPIRGKPAVSAVRAEAEILNAVVVITRAVGEASGCVGSIIAVVVDSASDRIAERVQDVETIASRYRHLILEALRDGRKSETWRSMWEEVTPLRAAAGCSRIDSGRAERRKRSGPGRSSQQRSSGEARLHDAPEGRIAGIVGTRFFALVAADYRV